MKKRNIDTAGCSKPNTAPHPQKLCIDQPTTDEDEVVCEPAIAKVRTCECRYCKGEAVELGRLQVKQTNRIVEMASVCAKVSPFAPRKLRGLR